MKRLLILLLLIPSLSWGGWWLVDSSGVIAAGGGITGIYGNDNVAGATSPVAIADHSMTLRKITIDGNGDDPDLSAHLYYFRTSYNFVGVVYDSVGDRVWYSNPTAGTGTSDPYVGTLSLPTGTLNLPTGDYWVGVLCSTTTPAVYADGTTGQELLQYNTTSVPYNAGVPPASLPTEDGTSTSNAIIWLDFGS